MFEKLFEGLNETRIIQRLDRIAESLEILNITLSRLLPSSLTVESEALPVKPPQPSDESDLYSYNERDALEDQINERRRSIHDFDKGVDDSVSLETGKY